MGSSSPPSPNPDDYSAAKTLISFPCPIPLLRGPIKSDPSDDPSSGPYLLAFKNRDSWAAAYLSSKAQIIQQCESGARIGCSISASAKCKPPWWNFLLPKQDFTERAKCEEIEMEKCFSAAKERCVVFAKNKCEPAFKNARVELRGLDLRHVDLKEMFWLFSGVCFADKKSYGVGVWGNYMSWRKFRGKYEVTNVRGRDLIGNHELEMEDNFTEISQAF